MEWKLTLSGQKNATMKCTMKCALTLYDRFKDRSMRDALSLEIKRSMDLDQLSIAPPISRFSIIRERHDSRILISSDIEISDDQFLRRNSRLFSVPESEHHPRIIRHISRVNFSNKRLERNGPIPNPPRHCSPAKSFQQVPPAFLERKV